MPEENKNSIFKKAILAALCCWLLVSIYSILLLTVLPLVTRTGTYIVPFLSTPETRTWKEIKEILIYDGILYWLALGLRFNISPFFLPFIITPLIFGFFFGLKFLRNGKKNRIFIFPPLFIFLGFIPILFFLVIFTSPVAGHLEQAIIESLGFYFFPYLLSAFIISFVLFFKKRVFFFFIGTLLFFIGFIGLAGGLSKHAEAKVWEERRQAFAIEKFISSTLIENAVKNKNPDICEEVKEAVEDEEFFDWFEAKRHDYYYFRPEEYYYDLCLTEVAKTLPFAKDSQKICEKITYELQRNKCQKEVQEIILKLDETANWKTYRNDDIGIEFRYPEEFFGVPYVFKKEKSEEYPEVFSGKSEGVSFREKGLYFAAYTFDYKAFKESSFNGDENITVRCPQPLIYDERGNVCKIQEVAGENAIFENRLFEDECAIALNARVYFNNRSKSIYKGLLLSISLDDANEKIDKLYDCSDEGARKAHLEAIQQSKNIMEGKNLSEKDQKKLNIFNQILSTFKFLE